MKHRKKILAVLIAALCAGLVMVPAVPAKAASPSVYINRYTDNNGNTKSFAKEEGTTFSEGYFYVYEEDGNHPVQKLKANKKGIKLAVTSVHYTGGSYQYRESTISYYATKAGTYKVSFKVGAKSYSVKIKVTDYSNLTAKVTFGKQVVFDYNRSVNKSGYTFKAKVKRKVTGKSGKLKVKAAGPYKITGLASVTFNKKGEPVYKKLKNGGKLTLSKGYEKTAAYDKSYSYTSEAKYTYVYVSYKNTFTGESVTYSVGTNPDTKKKCLVCTEKDRYGTDTYYTSGSGGADIRLWQY